jgi:flagellar L-ring protein precursor FlgH
MPKEGFNDLYSDLKASKVGDIIYVQVIESINAVESVASQTGRSASFKESVASLFGISAGTLDRLSAQGSGQFGTSGTGKVQQTGLLTTKLAGRVVKVYPNGTMLIEAKKAFYMNNAQREVLLRGIVRPQDIDSSNTITSDKIANLEVYIDGRGFLADGGSPGWLARILAKVLPF